MLLLAFLLSIAALAADPEPEDASGDAPQGGHWSQVRSTHRVVPTVPAAARSLPGEAFTCRVHFDIDAQGVPDEVTVSDCPEVLHASVLEAAYQWRFEPARDEQGEPTPATFILDIAFRDDASYFVAMLGGGVSPPLAYGDGMEPLAAPSATFYFGDRTVAAALSYRNGAWHPGESRLNRLTGLLGATGHVLEGEAGFLGLDILGGGGPAWWADAAGYRAGLGLAAQVGLPMALLKGGQGVGLRPAVGVERYWLSGGRRVPPHLLVELFYADRED